MKNIIKITTLSLVAAALMAMPVVSTAQDTTTNSMDSASSTNAAPVVKKKHTSLPFHGAIVSLDASAGSFTVGELNLNITSKTKITSTNGVPATLADFKIGDKVSGAYRKTADGTLNVTMMHLGGGKKKHAPAAAQ
jgi:hypothetical protein